MRSSLVIDRRQLDMEMTRVRYLLETHYPDGSLTEQQIENLVNDVYEAFSYYIEMICSRVMGGPSVEYILDEYLHGMYINPNTRDIVISELSHSFETASRLVRNDLANLTREVESQFEDITDVQFIAPGLSKLGVFMLESEPLE